MNGEDFMMWKFGTNGHFSVKSTYKAMTSSDVGPYHKESGGGKLPPKSI
jgi:hypothetical protein